MNEDVVVLGSGKDGLVVYPPIICSNFFEYDNKYNYVGKIYITGRTAQKAKNIIDKLPDEYDGVLYYKENYICNLHQVPDNIKLYKHLTDEQLILRYIKGDTLDNTLIKYININDNYKYMDLLESSIKLYYNIEKIVNEYKVYFNDIGSSNTIYKYETNQLFIIDLDDITFGSSRSFPVYFDDKINKKFIYKGKIKYKYWYWNVIDLIIKPILENMFDAYDPDSDDYLINKLDEINQNKFIKRKRIFEDFIGKSYNNFSNEDMDYLRNNFNKLKQLICLLTENETNIIKHVRRP